MPNFSIATQIKNELKEFRGTKIKLAAVDNVKDDSVRMLKQNKSGYFFNQAEMISIIDLYYNSKFQNGIRDKLGQRKIFMNVGKFRSDVSSKQITLAPKDFRFVPDDYADPYTAYFMQKDFKVWSRDMGGDDDSEDSFGALVDTGVDNYPRYGTVVLKKVKGTLVDVPLQNLANEQTAKSLQSASYVIEQHPDMFLYEIQEMAGSGWNIKDLENMKFNQQLTVYERYGHVPVKWLKAQMKAAGKDESTVTGDDNSSVDAMVFVALDAKTGAGASGEIVFYAAQCRKRPYREKHWARQHGRWLGIGVMEDLVENQEAKNIIVNLERRSLHWASKRVWQSATTDAIGKNLVRDVQDGEIIEVGTNGQITQIDMTNKALGEFINFGGDWDKNSDQKAFTYEAALLSQGNAQTPFRLGALLSNSASAFFNKKKMGLGLFYRDALLESKVPQFIRDMSNIDRVVSMFPGEYGYETLKAAAESHVHVKASFHTMLGGMPVDASVLTHASNILNSGRSVLMKIGKDAYKNAQYSFDLVVADTDDTVDLQGTLKTLQVIYQAMVQAQDPRAEKVLERMAAISGVSIESFGPLPPKQPQLSTQTLPGAGQTVQVPQPVQ